MPSCNVSLYCPPMEIYAVDGQHKRTAAEPMVATITWPSGAIRKIRDIIIPPTIVDKQRLWRWVVEKCRGANESETFVTNLPEELTTLNWSSLFLLKPTMTAQPIDAPTTLRLPDGSVWCGPVHWGPCTVRNILGPVQTADKITATGTLVQQ